MFLERPDKTRDLIYGFECSSSVKATAGAPAYLLFQGRPVGAESAPLSPYTKPLALCDYYFHFILRSRVMILPM